LEPGAVTETRTWYLRNQSISVYLIKWKNLHAEDSMGGQEFYTEASRTTQALRTTLFEG